TLNGATLPTYTTTLRAVSTRNPNEVDSNNNAAIDIRNSRQNNQPTSNSNEERNRRINDENNRNIVSPTVIVTARPDRFVFHRRTIRTPTRNRVKYRPQPSTPSRRNPNKEAKKRLSEGVIAGIVVGLLVIIVVLSGTVYKIVSRRKKQNETHQQEVANYIQVENSQIPTDHLANDLGHKNNAYSGPVVHSSPVTNMNKEPGGKVRHCGDKISLNVVEPPKIHTTRKSDQNTQQSSNQQRQTRKKTPRNNRVHKRRETSQKGRSRRQDTSRAKRSRKQSHPKQRSRDISKNTDRPKNRA
uniref:Uncharacterized protein n=1 Tax=Ciona savignyi TaxID=51511 RepID=H2YSN9_CIOSA